MKEIAPQLRIDGFGFDVEILYLAQKTKRKIKEVPIDWSAQSGSKVRVLRDGLKMFGDILRIKANHFS